MHTLFQVLHMTLVLQLPVVITVLENVDADSQMTTQLFKQAGSNHTYTPTNTLTFRTIYRFFLLSFFGFCRICGAAPLGFFVCSVAFPSVDSASSCKAKKGNIQRHVISEPTL